MKFLITGDLVVNQPYNASQKIDPQLIDLFTKSDCNIINLEAPVTTNQKKIIKTGPYLKAHRDSTLDVLKTLNIHIAALANNHIKDYDEQGVLDTIIFCQNNGIETIGAGKHAEDAAQTKVVQTSEGIVAIINIAENEWASAEENSAGANGMCLIKDTKKIQQAKQTYDFVFVIIHGGHEYYNLPSPRMQRQYRFYAEQGADLVVGHHTHCINGHEIYKGTPIFYSLGNFLFTKDSPHTDWYTGLVLQVELSNKKLTTHLLPIQQSKETFELRQFDDNQQTLGRIAKYNEIIQDKTKLEKAWNNYVLTNTNTYCNYWSILSFIKNKKIKGIMKRLKLNYAQKFGQILFLNLMRCEAHYDLSREILKNRIKKVGKWD